MLVAGAGSATTTFDEGFETTTCPIGTSQVEPSWVVTVEPTGGHPGMVAVVP